MSDKDIARIVRPENKIKKKIGEDANVRELLKPEVVKNAQKVITDKKDDFMNWALEDLASMEGAYQALVADNTHFDSVIIIMQHAETLRDRSGTFGYQLGSQVAKSLAKYCRSLKDTDESAVVVIRKHLDGLQIVFKQNIQGSGDMIGTQLMAGLQKLVGKYQSEW